MLPTVLRGPAEVAIILGIVYIAYYQAHGPFQIFSIFPIMHFITILIEGHRN